MTTIDPEFPPARRHGRPGNSDQTITPTPPRLWRHSIAIGARTMPPRLREIAKQVTAAAHAVASGQVFGRIVRHTWRIAAFAKQPELEGAAIALACMVRVFGYDPGQRSSVRSTNMEIFARPADMERNLERNLAPSNY